MFSINLKEFWNFLHFSGRHSLPENPPPPKKKKSWDLRWRLKEGIKDLRSKKSREGGEIPPPSPNLLFSEVFSLFCGSGGKKSAKKIGKGAGDKELCHQEEPPVIQGPSKGISVIPAPLPSDFLELCALEMSPELPRVDFLGKVTLVLHQKTPFAFYSVKKKVEILSRPDWKKKLLVVYDNYLGIFTLWSRIFRGSDEFLPLLVQLDKILLDPGNVGNELQESADPWETAPSFFSPLIPNHGKKK